MSALEEMGDAICSALDQHSAGEVLSVIAGTLVGLVVELTRQQGLDPDMPITIEVDGQRKITIQGNQQEPRHG